LPRGRRPGAACGLDHVAPVQDQDHRIAAPGLQGLGAQQPPPDLTGEVAGGDGQDARLDQPGGPGLDALALGVGDAPGGPAVRIHQRQLKGQVGPGVAHRQLPAVRGQAEGVEDHLGPDTVQGGHLGEAAAIGLDPTHLPVPRLAPVAGEVGALAIRGPLHKADLEGAGRQGLGAVAVLEVEPGIAAGLGLEPEAAVRQEPEGRIITDSPAKRWRWWIAPVARSTPASQTSRPSRLPTWTAT